MRHSLWISTRERRLHSEWMDEPDLDVVSHQTALQALSRINILSLSHRILWPEIRNLARTKPHETVRVLDVACGGGDVTLRLARAASRMGLKIQIDGCDLSETAVALASGRAAQIKTNTKCRFFQFNALSDNWPTDYDVVCSSLFLHHLQQDSAEQWLSSAARAAKRLVLVSDLVRSHWGYLLACVFSRVMSRSPIVHYDGPVSVAGAFSLQELRDLAIRSGLKGATVKRRWPARMLLRWGKP
jgi:2-polyprenyl-3-methyl-5-hydroxy-6-metoxy-1,4-benzoquinol methylase